MKREKLYAKKGLFGTTVFVNKQGTTVGKPCPNFNSKLIRDSKGRVAGKSYGNVGIGFSTDSEES